MSDEPDENFDHELVVNDTEEVIYKAIVLRREKLLSIGRFVMQMISFASMITCIWLFLITTQWRWIPAAFLFLLLVMGNAQVMNYRVLLPTGLRKESNEQ